MALAMDVSNVNGAVDWDKAFADMVRDAWAKATEGLSFLDRDLLTNAKSMRRLGIRDGYYHYAHPDEDPIRQADWFVDSVLRSGGFGYRGAWLDIEVTGGLNPAQLTAWMHKFLNRVDQRTGKRTGIYCSTSFGETCFYAAQFSNRPLWLASYGVSSPRVPRGWSAWDYWQYTDVGHVNGVNGNVDLDYIAGEESIVQTLMEGAKGDAVKTLQDNLKLALGLGGSFVVDGVYGPATAAAVKSFQLQNKLTVDGIAGAATMQRLDSVVKEKRAQDTTKPAETTKQTAPVVTAQITVDATDIKAKVAHAASLLAQAEAILKSI